MPWGYRLRRAALRPAPAPQDEGPQGAHPAKRPLAFAFHRPITLKCRVRRDEGVGYLKKMTVLPPTRTMRPFFSLGLRKLLALPSTTTFQPLNEAPPGAGVTSSGSS